MKHFTALRRLVALIGLTTCLVAGGSIWPYWVLATNPTSSNYQLNNYSFGSGGSAGDMGSTNFGMYNITGEHGAFMLESNNYGLGGGLLFTMQTPTPAAPSLTNPHNYYDRLLMVLDASSDVDGTTYAVAISRDNFATTQYVSSAGTVKNQLEASDYQSYDDWGGSDGMIISNLYSNRTYKIKVKATMGDYTESGYSPEAEAETEVPSLSFTIDGSANMGIWNENNNYGSTAVSTLTISTNAYNGYSVYAYATAPLTRSNGTETIPQYVGTYANPGSWLSGQGFGYTTNDTLVGGVAKWNAATCPADGGPPLCYAAFSTTAPGDIVVDNQTTLEDGPIVDEEFLLTYKAVTQAGQTAGVYRTTIIYTIVPTY